jgi:hypothetical protein
MSTLLVLPLLPLAVAGWLAVSPRADQLSVGWVVALVAAFPVAMAALAAPDRIELPELLVQGNAALVFDPVARAAVLLFGGLWLTTGLLLTRTTAPGPSAIALLAALSGAMTLAIAEGGPLVYTGLLTTGYGVYLVMACEPGDDWRRAARALIVLLVLSDLLVFELLLSAAASPGTSPQVGLLLLGLVALVLRAGIPPAHAWLPSALVAVGAPVAILLIAVLPAAAVFAALKLLPGGSSQIGVVCLLLAVAGAAWMTLAGLAQTGSRATLGYATAATATLLLLALPAGAGPEGEVAWLVVALLGACAALPLVPLQRPGWTRDIATALVLLVHGLAAGHAVQHAVQALPLGAALFAPLPALCAVFLLTLAARRTAGIAGDDAETEPTRLTFVLVLISTLGLGLAWTADPPRFASTWVAPVGITLGLLTFRFLPAHTRPRIPPGDLLGVVERAVAQALRWLAAFCSRRLPRIQQRGAAWLLGLWNGAAWSRRIKYLDLRLRAWPSTSLMMILVALGAAFLLAK